MKRHATNDFNGDGRSDILWRTDTNDLTLFYSTANGGFIGGPTVLWTTSATAIGTGDFNGDGREDILLSGGFSNANGTLLISAVSTPSAGFQPDWESAIMVPAGWSVGGTGDFNGDGKTDVLLRHTDGRITDWLIGQADATIVGVPDAPFVPSSYGANPGNAWHVVGVGDFNGDGMSDVLWRNDNGLFGDWLGQANGGFTDNSANSLVGVPTDWHVVATGDYNGDGIDDVLWRNDNGLTGNWLGRSDGGFTVNAANSLVLVDTHWQVEHSPTGFL
jgi:hypothetical protein